MRTEAVQALAASARADGREVVVVLGLGFVGTAVVASLARAAAPGGAPRFFVIGLDRDVEEGRAKAARLDEGRAPTYADDPSLSQVLARAAAEPRVVVGSCDPAVLREADVVVSCINLDVHRERGQTERIDVPVEDYAAALRAVGRNVRADTLVCVESTLPIGMCDQVLLPALTEGLREQGVDTRRHPPLLAYCYERVMPGPDYLDSVDNFWRAYAGASEAAAEAAHAFLGKFVNVEQYPLWRHKSLRAAEMGKLLENAYRATNIAFIEEWARLAERSGVDLPDVIRSIRLRRGTHDNMMLPGLGVGGYCLTKDALLAAYGAERLLGLEADLAFSRRAILTNERMPLRAVELVERHFGGALAGLRACLLGVTYRPGVADTRSSPSETVARALLERGCELVACDTLVERWPELPDVPLTSDPEAALEDVSIVVVCVPDERLRARLPELLVRRLRPGAIVVDPWNVVAEEAGLRLATRGVRLEVFGRGDVPAPARLPAGVERS